jgi:phosphonate transport system substrate-binding protein
MKKGWICGLLLLLISAGCPREHESSGPRYGAAPKTGDLPVYHFAIHPLHNPNKRMEAYQPLIDYQWLVNHTDNRSGTGRL